MTDKRIDLAIDLMDEKDQRIRGLEEEIARLREALHRVWGATSLGSALAIASFALAHEAQVAGSE